jgi:cellobiose phosphorylase
MYRLIIESLLGLDLQTDKLYVTPCLPAGWNSFKMHYRYRETVYHIAISRAPERARLTVDGIEHPGNAIVLIDDHKEHTVEIAVMQVPA